MTREEAIENLKWLLECSYVDSFEDAENEALDMAIKALEQEPCSDVVSRQAVETLVDELARAISDERCCVSRGRSTATIMQDILDLPSVNPQEPKTGHWISDFSHARGCYVYICDKCEKIFLNGYDYCPNCGARMESEE